jgi:hypothetical protein
MSTLVTEINVVGGEEVRIGEDTLTIDLADGRSISIPLAWYPRLLHGRPEERTNWQWIGDNEGIHWPDLDEDISVEGIIAGRRSGESQRSLGRWLEGRSDSATAAR